MTKLALFILSCLLCGDVQGAIIQDGKGGCKKSEGQTAKGAGVNIYVLASGVRESHSEFGGRASNVFNAVKNEECNAIKDIDGYGTYLASVLAGSKHGVAPGAKLHAVKVLDDDGAAEPEWVFNGIDWVARYGKIPGVVNLALGWSLADGDKNRAREHFGKLGGKGLIVVIAAGNESDDACNYSPSFLGGDPNGVFTTVGWLGTNGKLHEFSSFGPCVDLYAPGSDISGASAESDVATVELSGSAMASAIVGGAAAVVLGNSPTLPVKEVKSRLKNVAVGRGKGTVLPAAAVPSPPPGCDDPDDDIDADFDDSTFDDSADSA